MFIPRNMRALVSLLVVLTLVCSIGWAQSGTSSIRGTITDPQGNAVAGAMVTITNPETGFTRSQSSSNTGAIGFDLLPPGDYKLTVEAKGFKKSVLTVHATIGSPADGSVKLQLGQVSETVEVSAVAGNVEVNHTDATLGNAFVSSQITQLPLEARNVTSLLTLQPGVTSAGYVAGARSDQSNVTLDGVDINEAQTNAIGSQVLRLNSEAIQEFRVTTMNANANQGRSSAAQIGLITKGGSNTWHGSAFEFYRSTGFTANDYFNNRSGVPRPKLLRHTFGAAGGGPIKKDKLFIFYSFEGRRDTSQSSATRTVPLPSMGLGQLKYLDTAGVVQTLTTAQLAAAFPAVGMNAAAAAALGAAATKYPANDFGTTGDSLATSLRNTAGFRFNFPTPVKLMSHVGRLDWNINSKQNFFGRANVIYDKQAGLPAFPDTPAPTTWSHPWGGVLGHTYTLTNNLINNFRYGYTREAFSTLGDSTDNNISFRFIFSPRNFTRTLSRTTPVQNLTDDISWIKGKHSFQFGTAMWFTANGRTTYANAFDSAITNPSGYQGAGTPIRTAIQAFIAANALPTMASASFIPARDVATALIGRYTGYAANFTFDHTGALLAAGTPTARTFATQQYDFYFQDSWKLRNNLTLTYGLRWGIGSPVHETKGFEIKPDISLSTYFQSRLAAAAKGQNYTVPLTLNLSGPANGKSYMYPWDKNNFQPRVGLAWSPGFEGGIGKLIFGREGQSSIRSGFAMTNDYFGQALAVAFDLNNTLGFSSSQSIPVNTFNATTTPGPLFTGYNQAIRPLPLIVVPGNVTFPRTQPNNPSRIENSFDEGLIAPTNYQWNLTYERELPKGMFIQASYLGRLGKNLLAQRDVMQLNNLKDPASGMDWYTAATQLEKLRQLGTPVAAVASIPYFNNLFPANLGNLMSAYEGDPGLAGLTPTQAFYYIAANYYGNDWTDTQIDIEGGTGNSYWFNQQYGALNAWGTIANSSYHALTMSLRQRYKAGLVWDLNYTYSHSMDNSSGLQTAGNFATSSFILNSIRPNDNRANSDFDVRHQVNFNSVYQLPFGRGKMIGGNVNRIVDAFIGDWQLSSIFRWNTGLPINPPFDSGRWATNWNISSNETATRPVPTCITKGNVSAAPALFGCNTVYAYQSWRNAYPGETGQRNTLRAPGYVAADMGLSKGFKMPYNEKHKLQLRWEVFNVTNTQRFNGALGSIGMVDNPLLNNAQPPVGWSAFTGIQGTPRVMQIGARFEF